MLLKRKLSFVSIMTICIIFAGCLHAEKISNNNAVKSNSSQPNSLKPNLLTINKSWLDASYNHYLANSFVHKHVVELVIEKADIALSKGPYSVLDKSMVAPSGDKKDYLSVGPYWWPDESKPDGLPWIKRDGQVNPTSKAGGSDKMTMNNMLFQISDLALAYHYTKEEKYALHASNFINSWFLDDKTGMNPSLNFGQAVPGKSAGRPYGIVETRWFIRLIDDVALISPSNVVSLKFQQSFKQWITDYLNWLVTKSLGQKACAAHNNHGTYCEAQIAVYALYADKHTLAKEYVKRVFNERLVKQIEPDGSQPDELSRTRPLHYSLFNLEAYFYAARVGEHLGLDLWTYTADNGASLKKAIDFIVLAINKEGYWKDVKDKKMRRGRLYYFLQYAYQKYGDEKYQKAIDDISTLVIKEDRSEMSQCFLIMPKPDNITLSKLSEMDPTGKKSKYRCYY